MKVNDAERYRSSEVNRDLFRVYLGADLIGQVRMGMDRLWYPELPGERFKSAAMQRVIIANEAITAYLRGVDGHG